MRTSIVATVVFLSLAVALSVAANEYRVGPEDVLKISVYEHADLETVARVENDGRIQFPLVGVLEVQGKTTSQISRDLERLLADGYLVDPDVAVFIEEFKSRKVVVMGQVKKPGLYELTGPLTVVEVISRAGGFTDIAAQRNVKIIRKGEEGEQTLDDIDFSDAIMPDDVVVVPESLF